MKKDAQIKLYSEGGLKEKLSLIIASCFFTGYLPIAPGTWGSAFTAIIVYFLIPTQGFAFLVICLAVFAAGVIATNIMERYDGTQDDSKIVIDEALGILLAVAFLPKIPMLYLAAFIIFRIFDIAKPPPIKQVDKNLRGGIGVMLDDVIAGIFTNIVLRVILVLI